MGTTQKGIIARTIGMLFAAGSMGKNGGSFIPSPSYAESNIHIPHHYRGNSKHNNRQPSSPKFSFVRRANNAGYGIFRNLSTGETERRKIASTASALGSSARSLTKSTQQYFGI